MNASPPDMPLHHSEYPSLGQALLRYHREVGSPAHRAARLLLRGEKPVLKLLHEAAAEMRAFPEHAILPQSVNDVDRQQVEHIAQLLLSL